MINREIKLLDCTLRDGGYINDWSFSNKQIITIITSLKKAKINIIELGYLNNKKGKTSNSTLFDSIETIDKLLRENQLKAEKVIMINLGDFDISKLTSKEKSSIDGIRLAFHKKDIEIALKTSLEIINLGYKLYFQPMITKNYEDIEFLSLIDKVNKLDIYAFYIVDSFGSMTLEEFQRYMILANSNLNKDISLGYHSHNNMQLAFSNAIKMCNTNFNRNIIIDASIYGVGRGAGNLNTELIADYLNNTFHKNYNILPLLETIDDFLNSLMHETPWGFSPAQYLSASFNCHPNYATYLINKNTKSIVEIHKVLEKLPKKNKSSFDKDLIEKLYIESILETKTPIWGTLNIISNKKVVLIASGKSIEDYSDIVNEKIRDENYTTIALNYKPSFECDYYFFSNQKRFDIFKQLVPENKIIITSNLISDIPINIVLDFKNLVFINNKLITNVAIIMINYLSLQNIKNIELAGLDGFSVSDKNYSYNMSGVVQDKTTINQLNQNILYGLKHFSDKLNLLFLTPSIFTSQLKQRIIGVIPSRYASERLPGKPLYDIDGLPMVIHVLKRAMMSKVLDELIVATDDERIFKAVEKFGGKAMMTSSSHNNASERIFELSKTISGDIYVMINGDEPLMNPKYIDLSVNALINNEHCGVSILYNKFYKKNSPSDFKVAINNNKEIMYISRSDIPSSNRNSVDYFYKAYHIVSYTKEMLNIYMSLEQTNYDYIESHELLRLLENGYKIQGIEVESSAISVDIQKDLEIVREMMKTDSLYNLYKQ